MGRYFIALNATALKIPAANVADHMPRCSATANKNPTIEKE
jgi:hypothetical protein